MGADEQAENPRRGRRLSMRVRMLVGREGVESFMGSIQIVSFFSMKFEAESLIESKNGKEVFKV